MIRNLATTNDEDKAILMAMSHISNHPEWPVVRAYLKRQLHGLDVVTRSAGEQNLYNLQGATKTLAKLINQFDKAFDFLKAKE